MKLKRLTAALLMLAVLLPILSIQAFAWVADESTEGGLYGSRYSNNPDDWFAEGPFVDTDNYVMPDYYNTGYVSAYEDLVDFGEKYPAVAKKVNSNGTVTYNITETTAKHYGYVFTGFKIIGGSISVTNNTKDIVIRDFLIEGTIWEGEEGPTYKASVSTGIANPRPAITETDYNIGRLIILDGEITGTSHAQLTGFNFTARRLYLHKSLADHVKGFTGQTIVSCLLTDGGLNGGNPHPDCIQYSVDDGHGKGLDTTDVYVYGNRFDIPQTSRNVTNAAIMLKSEFGGGLRNVNICKNWFNGGGAVIQIFNENKYTMRFFEDINVSDNIFGHGEQYMDTRLMFGNDSDGVSLKNKTTHKNNVSIVGLQIGSVVYYSGEDRIIDLADANGSLSVKAVVANYELSAMTAVLQAKLYNAAGQLVATTHVEKTIDKYIRHADHKDDKTFRYEDQPVNEEITLSFAQAPADLSGHYVVVDVYQVKTGKTLELLREDSLTVGGAKRGAHKLSVPTGYSLYDTNANSPSNLFVQTVNTLPAKNGEDLRLGLVRAYEYFDEAEDSINGVTEAKALLAEQVARYNRGVAEENALVEQGLDIVHASTDLQMFWKEAFDAIYAWLCGLFAWL